MCYATARGHGSVCVHRALAGGSSPDGGEHHLTPPSEFGPEFAEKAVHALRGLSKNWLSLMCKVGAQSTPVLTVC